MKSFKVTEEAYIRYQMTTWQGEVEVNGQTIAYRYSEDDNGATLYILEEDGWVESPIQEESHILIYAAIMQYGNAEEFKKGETVEIQDEDLEFYI